MQTATITLKGLPAARIYAARYDERPRYIFYAGLVLQPLDLNMMSAHRLDDFTNRYLYTNYVQDAIFQEREDVVVITRVESSALTANLSGFAGAVVNTINGEKVHNLAQAYELLYPEDPPEFTVIECESVARPLVIPSDQVEATNKRLMELNSIPSTHYLEQ